MREFIATFSKIDMNHDELSWINGLKQGKDELVPDCVVRLKQYISRCPFGIAQSRKIGFNLLRGTSKQGYVCSSLHEISQDFESVYP